MASFPAATLGYLLAYSFPVLAVASVGLGRLSGHPDILAFLPLAMVYLFVPLYQEYRPRQSQPLDAAVRDSPAWRRWYRILPLFAPLPQLVMLIVATGAWCDDAPGFWGRLGLPLGTGPLPTLF